MKKIKYLFIAFFFSAFIISCATDTNVDANGDATVQRAAKQNNAHAGHDHSGHNHDHAGHDHSGHNHDHAGHDHSGHNHDHAGHDHSGHNHAHGNAANKNAKSKEDVNQLRANFEKAKKEPPTSEQKKTAKTICECMEKNDLFAKVANLKTQEAFNKTAGENYDKAKEIQQCHNTIMPAVIKNMGSNAGIYAYKSRDVINSSCLKGNSDFWLLLGKYIAQNPLNSKYKNLKRNQSNGGAPIHLQQQKGN